MVPTDCAATRSSPSTHHSTAQLSISATEAPPKSGIPPKPTRSDSAHPYGLVAEAYAGNDYTYAIDTVKTG